MATTTEITELRRTISGLRQCVGALRHRYGESPVVRRLENDLERLDIDADDLAHTGSVPTQQPPRADRSEIVMVSDRPYDPSLWEGADDEGVGGYQRGRQ